jgi:hypothetical protein
MTKANIKNSAIVLAIGMVMVSCDGGNGNKQQSGSATTETKTEQVAPSNGGGKMAAFNSSETTGERFAEFLEVTGLKGIGKPVGYKFKGLGWGESIYTLNFLPEGEISQQDIDNYARAVWDLCSKVSKKPLFNWKDEPLKSFDDARRQNEPYNAYLWYYTSDNYRMRTTVIAEKNRISEEIEFEVKFEYSLLNK